MKYHIVKVFGLSAFVEEVNRLMKDDWRPTGSVQQVSVTGLAGDPDQWYMQAMVLEDSQKLTKKLKGVSNASN